MIRFWCQKNILGGITNFLTPIEKILLIMPLLTGDLKFGGENIL